jgi:N4-gp56 family major capsid protein
MAFSGNQYGDISPRVGIYAVANMLAYADTQIVLDKFAKVEAVPKNKGLTVRFRRPVPFEVNPTALIEGVTPAPQALEYEDVQTSLAQYGAWVPFTDVIVDTHEDPNLKVMSELCGKQAAETKELILWNEIRGGTQVFFTDGSARTAVATPVAINDIRAVVRQLKRNHCKKLTKILKASPNIATQPINASYVAVCHTDLEADIRALTGFVSVEAYGSGAPIHANEFGAVGEVRFISSPMLEPFRGAGATGTSGMLVTGTRADVYPIIIFGEDAYGSTPLKGMDSATIAVMNPKMAASYEDPLGQRGFVAWKMWYSSVRLNEQWMARIESACSAL